MTEEEILALPAGRGLDATIAMRVMGWRVCFPRHWGYDHENAYVPLPEYSTDIAAAWQVVKKVGQCWRAGHDPDGIWFRFVSTDDAAADTLPLAICRAALLACAQQEEIPCV